MDLEEYLEEFYNYSNNLEDPNLGFLQLVAADMGSKKASTSSR